MSIDKFRRVIWRLEELNHRPIIKLKELRLAIMKEIGTSEITIRENIKHMIELKYIKKGSNQWSFKLLVGRHEVT